VIVEQQQDAPHKDRGMYQNSLIMNGVGVIQQSDLTLCVSYKLKSSEQLKQTVHKIVLP
jgi:hypothetical protein